MFKLIICKKKILRNELKLAKHRMASQTAMNEARESLLNV
jgi:hypothetical protein